MEQDSVLLTQITKQKLQIYTVHLIWFLTLKILFLVNEVTQVEVTFRCAMQEVMEFLTNSWCSSNIKAYADMT